MEMLKRWGAGGLALGLLTLAGSARADMLGGLGNWRGSGTRFDGEGHPNGDFEVALTRSADGPSSVKTRGKITFSNGQVVPFAQRWTLTSTGFVSESARGKGTGSCLGSDLCYSHEDLGGGKTSLVTIMIDSPRQIRILVTDMDGGRPVQFIRQTLRPN